MTETSVSPGPPAGALDASARLAGLLDTAVDGIIVTDERGRILVYNAACERIFGYRAAEALGRNVSLIMGPNYAAAHDRYMSAYLATGQAKIIGIGREVAGRHKDGEIIPVELSIGEARVDGSRQFVGILRDVRQRKETERKLAEAQTELIHLARVSVLDEMASALAHELNQPLTALMLYLQTALRARPGAEGPGDALVGKALHEAERAAAIIRRMRGFVEKRAPERRTTPLNGLILDALELSCMGRNAGVSVVRTLAPGDPMVRVDPIQIQQVIVNLIRNAYDVLDGRDDGVIEVSSLLIDDGAEVRVRDNGPGVAPEKIGSLFQAFSSTKKNGLGIGLAISRSIAQNHGGDLTAEPGGGGKGACFVLRLQTAKDCDVTS